MRFCIVGAGFSGAIIARHLSEKGHKVLLLDERSHIAGNCHTERDEATGVMVHRYGPHIFHTADQRAWDYIQQFGTFQPYINRVKAISQGRMYTLPVNLLTINQFFNTTMSPKEARAFIEEKADTSIKEPKNFEEQALSMIGPELYKAFFYGYTRKQWGLEPTELPASILKRLPLRFNYDDNYFNHPYQGMPEEGYSAIVENILKSENIEIRLNTKFEDLSEEFQHVFYTGPIDRYFDFRLGRLGYRTLDFERIDSDGDYQGAAVINYCDQDVPFTRISEHKHFAPWEADSLKKTVSFREYSRLAEPKDVPYYPIRLANEKTMLDNYISLARDTKGVSFLGRLGTYRYLDMDVTISEALKACDQIDELLAADTPLPAFFIDPS
ncbi:UDP-galactopyranose mutase [Gluconobacter cerinus]|uniref:UDP-galactopyranose mutase n=1 Tax=Gluconobacter cerinus TaxID=38307 RepID=UPI001B8BC6C3|nr:UDP-galactopyranose mutase [Gluconobacter cerinus]MBS1041372.1 UDP-galactopyranose mutase [Gluconobacter cerinus]MBS1047567.1 UDP-galactopyranose mutase [Gluconobacter cerinus]MCW2266230.1 UDP-galactopyranose mutase [Gluconobacter cerinus]